MFTMFLDIFITMFKFFSPFLIAILVLVGVFFVLCLGWFFHFYKKGYRIQGAAPKPVKRKHMLYQLFVEVPRRYVLDIFERPADYFDPCGIHIFCGEQGAGKTISVVEAILRLQKEYPNALTTTNFALTTENCPLLKWDMLLTYNNGKKGVIVGIDEIQNWFMAGTNKLPEGMLEIVTQNRKNRRILFCTSQVFTKVNKGIREQVTLVYEPHTFLKCFTIVVKIKPIFDSEGNVIARKYRGMYAFVHTDEIRNAYDTYKCIHMLAKEGFKDPASSVEVTNNLTVSKK